MNGIMESQMKTRMGQGLGMMGKQMEDDMETRFREEPFTLLCAGAKKL